MTDEPNDIDRPLTRSERINIRISITQTVLALVGIFLGSVALYAALNESDAVRKQLQASVWPHVEITRFYNGVGGAERVDYIVTNSGIGPARIVSVKVRFDGVEQQSWREIVRRLTERSEVGISNDDIAATVIPAGRQVVMMSVTEEFGGLEATRGLRDAYDQQRLTIEICYCSVFDECWVRMADAHNATPIARCPAHDENVQF